MLDIKENMNDGKTHAFFSWAAENAIIPRIHSSRLGADSGRSDGKYEQVPLPGNQEDVVEMRRPDWVMKADDDSFIMLGELERRLRVAPKTKTFWGCECYSCLRTRERNGR